MYNKCICTSDTHVHISPAFSPSLSCCMYVLYIYIYIYSTCYAWTHLIPYPYSTLPYSSPSHSPSPSPSLPILLLPFPSLLPLPILPSPANPLPPTPYPPAPAHSHPPSTHYPYPSYCIHILTSTTQHTHTHTRTHTPSHPILDVLYYCIYCTYLYSTVRTQSLYLVPYHPIPHPRLPLAPKIPNSHTLSSLSPFIYNTLPPLRTLISFFYFILFCIPAVCSFLVHLSISPSLSSSLAQPRKTQKDKNSLPSILDTQNSELTKAIPQGTEKE